MMGWWALDVFGGDTLVPQRPVHLDRVCCGKMAPRPLGHRDRNSRAAHLKAKFLLRRPLLPGSHLADELVRFRSRRLVQRQLGLRWNITATQPGYHYASGPPAQF